MNRTAYNEAWDHLLAARRRDDLMEVRHWAREVAKQSQLIEPEIGNTEKEIIMRLPTHLQHAVQMECGHPRFSDGVCPDCGFYTPSST